jgi:hypothetical protein
MDKTFTFDANGGKFTDNTTVKTVTAPYGTKASFNEVPAKADDSQYSYTFAGWSDDKNATTGSSFSSFVINGDSTLYAVYTKAPIYATLTFYAGQGHFADGSTQKTLRVLAGSMAPAFNETPQRDSTETWNYTFTGWAPAYQSGTVVGSDAMSIQSPLTQAKAGLRAVNKSSHRITITAIPLCRQAIQRGKAVRVTNMYLTGGVLH